MKEKTVFIEYWFNIYQMCLYFTHYDEIRLVEKGELDDMDQILEMRADESDGLVIAFYPGFTNEEIADLWDEIRNVTDLNHLIYRYTDSANNVYYACTQEDEYYYENGLPVVSQEKYIDGEWYYFDENGKMVKDKDVFLENDGGKWVRYDEEGRRVKGEDYNYNGWYYLDEKTGAMTKGAKVLDDGRKVYYDPISGQMQRGKYKIDGKMYHFDMEDGHLLWGQSDKIWRTSE